MGFGQKLGARLLDGAVVAAAVALAWRLHKPSPSVVETYPSGWATDGPAIPGSFQAASCSVSRSPAL